MQELDQVVVKQPSPWLILDCRAKLGDASWGYQAYKTGHIPGALYANLDQDLAAPPGLHGRHPLPTQTQWLDTLSNWGITPETQVVTYDDAGGAYAARAWWMLRWVGHGRVAVLDGGLHAYTGDLELVEPATPKRSAFAAAETLTKLISTQDLCDEITLGEDSDVKLIDARAVARWSGEEEPIDPIAGHIPGADCLPFQENLSSNGYFKTASELAERFSAYAERPTNAICYCGSGVTATHNILAMNIAGCAEPVLYADSWSGWITDSTRPIATTR